MWLEEQYINRLRYHLRNFKQLSRSRYQCACPYCGDSQKDKSKARGSFYTHKSEWWFHCFNCDVSRTVSVFLKQQNPDLYDEYIRDKFIGNRETVKKKTESLFSKESTAKIHDRLKSIRGDVPAPKIVTLDASHHARKYVEQRLIPAKYHHDLYYVEKFKEWSNRLVPDSFEESSYDEERLVIPFRNEQGDLIAFQGRSFNPNSKSKYITIKIHPDNLKIFGMDRVNPNEPIFWFEGPIDSMFIPNSLAMAGGNIGNIPAIYKHNIFVLDNEPRKPQTVKKLEKLINALQKVVIFKPTNIWNDINDAILQGETQETLTKLLHDRTFEGLVALNEFNNWRKV